MLDLLAAIVSVDPPSLLAWLILAFAASGYPLGIMLGSSCSPCCSQCGCAQGSLPDTVTLNIDGFSDGNTPGPDLAFLSFSSSFGEGASGKVTAPSGNAATDKGPITAVSLTDGGEGYARIARVQPTITASASGGSSASFSVSLSEISHEDRAAWEVSGVTVTNGGTGYPASGYVTFNTASGDTAEQSAYATFYSGRVTPTVTASVSGSGSGAVLSASLSSSTGYDGRTYWYVDGISITNGGTGYAEYDSVTVTVTDGEGYGAYAVVSSVDGSGAITGIAVYWGGEYYKSNGIISSVELFSGGIYYRDDSSIPGEKATVSIGVSQYGPTASTAAGAVLTAVIDDSASSPTFGKITGVTITNGGNNYLAWEYCEAYLRGITAVLEKSGDCAWGKTDCGRGFSVAYRGASTPPLVTIYSQGCAFTLTGETNVDDCSAMSFTGSDEHGRSVSVSPGGAPSALTCSDCIGTVTVGGQPVKINGPYTLVCVAPHIERPASPTNTYPIQMLSWAKASAYCHAGAGYLTEIWVDVQIGALGIVSFPYPQTPYDEAYDALELGAERNVDGDFAPYNFALSTVTRVLSLGPVRGISCVGGGPRELDIGFFTSGDGTTFPCSGEMSTLTRSGIGVNITCNAEE